MIPDFKTYIRESAWGDMMRRSSGEIIRKEDDVNNLDFDDFCKYLQEKYPPTGRTKWGSRIKIEQRLDSRNTDISILIIPIIVIDDFCKSMVAEYNSKLRKYTRIKISESILNKCENIKEMLGDKYNVKKYSDFHSIVTMDGEITNNNIAELADIFLHAIDDPVLKIDVNESAWGDMMRRSSGEMIRKEDQIKTNEELREIIYNLYKEQGEGDTLDVTSIALGKRCICDDLSELFKGYSDVKRIIGLETWDVSNFNRMVGMFYNCKNLTELNIDNWNVSNVTDMGGMFYNCKNLTELNISNWDVGSVTDMSYMFYNCKNLTELNISNWNVSNVTAIWGMFEYCESLTELNIDNWDVSNVTDMDYMFARCKNLTELNIDNWNVGNVTNMRKIFYDCNKLKKPKWYTYG